MAANASVEQLMAGGLTEIGAQLEFQRLIKEITQKNMEVSNTCTEILTSSNSSGSIRSVETVKPTQNPLKNLSDLDRKIYKAK